MTLSEYVQQQVDQRIGSVADAASRAQSSPSPEEIHQLRVAIRKLSECLRVFKDMFPRGAAKSVRKELKAAMKLAGEARNSDIARDLMTRAKVHATTDLQSDRDQAVSRLGRVLRSWMQSHAADAWRELLNA